MNLRGELTPSEWSNSQRRGTYLVPTVNRRGESTPSGGAIHIIDVVHQLGYLVLNQENGGQHPVSIVASGNHIKLNLFSSSGEQMTQKKNSRKSHWQRDQHSQQINFMIQSR